MISAKQAIKIILKNTQVLPVEEKNILAAFGQTLAEDIYARANIPYFSNSAMDGYALKARDVREAMPHRPKRLKIVGEVAIGKFPSIKLQSGQTARIFTGAPIPSGANVVVPVEATRENQGEVEIYQPVKRGANIRLAGEDVKKGDLVLKKGSLITPAIVGMCAALGREEIKVISRPRVAILSVGDELVKPAEKSWRGKIKDANSYSLYAEVLKYGGKPLPLGAVADKVSLIESRVKPGLKADILLTSGGVSVGTYDYLKNIFLRLKVKIKFHRVAQKPGGPLLFGKYGKTLVFGLPGNPVSVLVCFEEYVALAMRKMAGNLHWRPNSVTAELQQPINDRVGRTNFIRGIINKRNGKYFVKPTGPQGSGVLSSMVKTNGLIIVPERKASLKKGEKVKVRVL